MKKTEMFTELSIQLARIEDKLNKLLEQNTPKEIKISSFPVGYTGCARCGKWQCTGNCSSANEIRCYFESLSPEDRMKPMSISCPCKRCSPYSMSCGSIQSSEVRTVWMNPRSTLDCVGTDSCKTSEEAWTNTITGKLQE